ncbi:GNAT family N-acetyltransferase [Shouchella lonarensis]|uniref:Ribosomal protein S18 acetylase RimI n=1 Tax=Shouchella lonarensis TaxID=1464122 RepID=A0A1G6MIR6_9BACI|nr:GNAT family N-acetyltransferase [Shouchella lonarensis]SDC55409.1 Ribosomal protein S18 acetylase RimI [Shouchella lonarensis]
MNIRAYEPADERGWVRCRVLSFLDTAYYDNVLREKEAYKNPAIELVAEIDGQIVGLIDLELDTPAEKVCSKAGQVGGMIWHIAVHPDFQRQAIGTKLLRAAESEAKARGVAYLQAWTRDDGWVRTWYEKHAFTKVDSYLHVYMDGKKEFDQAQFESNDKEILPMTAFAHYIGSEKEQMKEKFARVHECICFQKPL